MIYNTKNPVALKSQKWLVEALLTLMKEKPYRDIKIKDITNKAQVDRSTFYRNFSSKEDILNLHVRQLAETYVKRLKTHKTLSMETVAQILITLCFENIQFFTLLRKESLSYFVLNHFNEKLPTIQKILADRFDYQINPDYLQYALAFNAGGMWNMLMMWIDNGMTEDISYLIKGFEEIAKFNAMRADKLE